MNIKRQDIIGRSADRWSGWRAWHPLGIRGHREKNWYKGVDREVRNFSRSSVQRKRGHSDEVLSTKAERFSWSIIYRNFKKIVILLLLIIENGWRIPALSKSMQFCSLASYHSEEAAATPEPPKALVFFLGVTGVDTLKRSIFGERAKKDEKVASTLMKKITNLEWNTPHVDPRGSTGIHNQKGHASDHGHIDLPGTFETYAKRRRKERS